MEKKKCSCGKVIEAYSEKHLNYLFSQHKLSKAHKKASKSKKAE